MSNRFPLRGVSRGPQMRIMEFMQQRTRILVLVVLLLLGVGTLAVIGLVDEQADTKQDGRSDDAATATAQQRKESSSCTVSFGTTTINTEVVETPAARRRGLLGRDGLEADSGMFFIFPERDRHGITMKGMQFPIDIVWLNGEYEVVDIKHDAPADEPPFVYQPGEPAQYVLELPAGYTHDHTITTGDGAAVDIATCH